MTLTGTAVLLEGGADTAGTALGGTTEGELAAAEVGTGLDEPPPGLDFERPPPAEALGSDEVAVAPRPTPPLFPPPAPCRERLGGSAAVTRLRVGTEATFGLVDVGATPNSGRVTRNTVRQRWQRTGTPRSGILDSSNR